MQQTINPADRRLGAKLTAAEPTGHLGCDTSRARPVGAVRARSDLLVANLTGRNSAIVYWIDIVMSSDRLVELSERRSMNVSPDQFRAQYHRMLEPRPNKYAIKKDSSDPWGIVITRVVVSGVQVWHAIEKQKLTLGITTPQMRALLPQNAVPPRATLEVSEKGWLMYRWEMPEIDVLKNPADQPNMRQVIQAVEAAFEWFRTTRLDLAGK